jgi:hypothetical protein
MRAFGPVNDGVLFTNVDNGNNSGDVTSAAVNWEACKQAMCSAPVTR